MDELSQFCCQNEHCSDYGKRGAGNLSVCDRYGANKERRLLYCATCKARFSERKGTPLFGARLSEQEAIAARVDAAADRRAALEDVLWALVNSKEFMLRK